MFPRKNNVSSAKFVSGIWRLHGRGTAQRHTVWFTTIFGVCTYSLRPPMGWVSSLSFHRFLISIVHQSRESPSDMRRHIPNRCHPYRTTMPRCSLQNCAGRLEGERLPRTNVSSTNIVVRTELEQLCGLLVGLRGERVFKLQPRKAIHHARSASF